MSESTDVEIKGQNIFPLNPYKFIKLKILRYFNTMPENKERLVQFLEQHRSLVVVLFCLPASFIFTYLTYFYLYIINVIFRSNHESKVKKITDQVKNWKKQSESKRKYLVNSRPNWQSLSLKFFNKKEHQQISVPLYEILSLDEMNLTVTVEPYVTIGQITKFLVKKGYMLVCTIEIKDATCGGLAMGVGMSTHSHKVGLYQESILKYGLVLPDGQHIYATKSNEYSDLFYMLPWSHGSLAILVSLELKIIPIKPYLKIRYRPIQGLEKYCNAIRKLSGALSKDDSTSDFVEATCFSLNETVIMTADFIDCSELASNINSNCQINRVNKWHKPYFFKHVQTYLTKPVDSTSGISGEEIIPIEDYLFRHNRSIFWVLQDIVEFCHNPLFRWCLGWLCPPKPAFLKFTTTSGIRELTCVKQVFQDIVLPMNVLEQSIKLSDQLFNIYPILVYPSRVYYRSDHCSMMRNPRPDQMIPQTDYAMFYDLGVYGVPSAVKYKEYYDAAAAMRGMEKFIRDNGGYSFLYADIFMNRSEFNDMFNISEYDKLRKKYHLEQAFHHVYDKVRPECDVIEISNRYSQSYKKKVQ